MYYEEKVINGILFYRNDPDKEWIEMSKEDLTARYIRTKNDNCVYAQLYEGWRDRSDKSYYNEKRILIFTPCYEDITMRWRLIDSQFMDLCTEASHWKKLDEPAFV